MLMVFKGIRVHFAEKKGLEELLGLCCCSLHVLLFLALADLYLFAAQLLCLLVQVQLFMLTNECMLDDCVHECWISVSVLRLRLQV